MAAMHVEGALIGALSPKRQGQLCRVVERPRVEEVRKLQVPPPEVFIVDALRWAALRR